jgi:hypothetical protein
VIFAEIGSAVAADAIFHDADTIHIETANDRAARCAWRVGRAGDAGLVVQKIAERGGSAAPDFLVGHDRDSGELIRDNRQRADIAIRIGAGAAAGGAAVVVRPGRAVCRCGRWIGLGACTTISGSVARAGIGLLRERRVVENKRDGHGRTAGH